MGFSFRSALLRLQVIFLRLLRHRRKSTFRLRLRFTQFLLLYFRSGLCHRFGPAPGQLCDGLATASAQLPCSLATGCGLRGMVAPTGACDSSFALRGLRLRASGRAPPSRLVLTSSASIRFPRHLGKLSRSAARPLSRQTALLQAELVCREFLTVGSPSGAPPSAAPGSGSPPAPTSAPW